jgi:hypothetical protein
MSRENEQSVSAIEEGETVSAEEDLNVRTQQGAGIHLR